MASHNQGPTYKNGGSGQNHSLAALSQVTEHEDRKKGLEGLVPLLFTL